MSFDWQPAWLNLQYQKKTPLPIRLNHEYVSMLFHIHSPWSYVCLGPCHERLTHTGPLSGGIWKKGWLIIQHFVCLCKRLSGSFGGRLAWCIPCGALLQDVVARALPHGSCPCQSAIDKMTEEVEYADQAEDNQQEFTSNCDLSCQRGHGEIHLWWNMHVLTCVLECVFMCVCVCQMISVWCVSAPWICVMQPASWC